MLLVDPDSYESHFERVTYTCTLGEQVFPDTFTPEVVRVIKAKVNLMQTTFETILTNQDPVPPSRDHPDVGRILVEAFLDRFERETDAEHFSPGVRSLYEAYDELLQYYEMPTGKELMEAGRIAAMGAREDEPPEFRRKAGFPARSPQGAAAATRPQGPGGPMGA